MRLDPEPHQWRHEEFDHRHKSSPAEDAYLDSLTDDRLYEHADKAVWPSEVARVRRQMESARLERAKRC